MQNLKNVESQEHQQQMSRGFICPEGRSDKLIIKGTFLFKNTQHIWDLWSCSKYFKHNNWTFNRFSSVTPQGRHTASSS